MSLEKYKNKRSPMTTPEPFDEITQKKKKTNQLLFVIQKHAASHLHYDFRLEAEGVLKSWAIPKGPSLNPKERRLAVMVEDHPFDYHNFEGTIPKGSYGGGTVMVWDTGTYIPLDEKGNEINEKGVLDGLKNGKLIFALKGSKLKGLYSLIRIKSENSKENWLLIKKNDEYASEVDILKKEKSVLTQRTIDEISESHTIWKNKPEKEKKKKLNKGIDLLPKIHPMLAFLVDDIFDDPDWIFETKWDGFRAIAEINDDNIELYSRNFLSFNARFKPIVEALKKLQIQAIFDGEIVVLDKNGKSSFQDLQNYQKTGKGDLRYCIFDFLYFEGYDMRDLPLIKRKELLEKIIKKDKNSLLLFSQHLKKFGKKSFLTAQKNGEEGIIAKNSLSTYLEGRSRDWIKIKTHASQEAVICGFTEPRGSRNKLGALILGIYREGELQYAGHVGGGFTNSLLIDVSKKLFPLITKKCPFKNIPPTNTPVTWVKPKLICEVSFHEWTSDNRMRQPIFKGLRTDKEAKEVKKENPIFIEKIEKKTSKISNEPPFTHLDKIFWPDEGYTKGMLIDYYREISEFILPYLKNRPQSLRRYPNGINANGFFQKNIDSSFPDWLKTFPVKHKDEIHNYLLISNIKTLLYVINLGCIDLNPFSSRIQNLENPDYIIFDLDPEDIPFEAVMDVAKILNKTLEKYGVQSYCKTSGSRGLHVLIPTGAKYSYEQVKLFAELICSLVMEQLPDITSMERSPKKRQKKVYLDYLQNNFGQTIAAPYSVRPKPCAPVSTPLEWNELKKGLLPTDFTIENIQNRIKKKGDFFKPILGKGINLSKILKEINLLSH